MQTTLIVLAVGIVMALVLWALTALWFVSLLSQLEYRGFKFMSEALKTLVCGSSLLWI